MPQPSTPLEEDELNGKPAQGREDPQRLYPDAFYCPLTQKVMEDPVVRADGDSFERSAVLGRDSAGGALQQQQTYYPNRALKIIIEQKKQGMTEQGTVRGALRKVEASLHAGFRQILEESALPTGKYRPLPDAYYCPITLGLVSRPAIDPDGYTYERQAILGWIRTNGNSPLTRNALSAEQLRGNNALDDLINAEANKGEHSIHPSMRRLKESRLRAADEESRPPGPPEACLFTYRPGPPEEVRHDRLSQMELEENRRPDQPEERNPSQEEIDEVSRGKYTCSTIASIFTVISLVCVFVLIPGARVAYGFSFLVRI